MIQRKSLSTKGTAKPFFIDQYEVTNEEYRQFVEATDYPPPWNRRQYVPGTGSLPVVNVTWFDAQAYAKWAGKRLPTETEWEYAARGTDRRLYPWGNDIDASRANIAESQFNALADVGRFSKGNSPFGVLDMAGNVAEWTDSDSFRYPGSQGTPKPGKIVRGGSFRASKVYAMTTTRTAVLGDRALPDVGFRCALNAPENYDPTSSPPLAVARSQNGNLNTRGSQTSNRNQSPDQQITGELIGNAKYLGSGIAGVDITIINIKSGVARSTSTDANGIFRVPSLQPGVYRIIASKRPLFDHPLVLRQSEVEG